MCNLRGRRLKNLLVRPDTSREVGAFGPSTAHHLQGMPIAIDI